ncbi:MAG TPA: hemerythrin domain-containing protein [Polyangia bacterium]|nr:hemerythrin domain-containing protein [Polyangia bacterium]
MGTVREPHMQTSHIRSRSDDDGATDLLRSQHREIDQLLAALPHAQRARDKGRLLAEVADLIAVHLAVEERVFYPALGANPGGAPGAGRAGDDRFELKRLAIELLETEIAGPSFDAAVALLRERFRAHARAEERVFLDLRQRLPRAPLRRLAYDMRVLEFQLRTDATLRETILAPSKLTAEA